MKKLKLFFCIYCWINKILKFVLALSHLYHLHYFMINFLGAPSLLFKYYKIFNKNLFVLI